MSEVLGDILPLAVVAALSPIPIIAIILVLGTPRARSNGPAFGLGWVAGLSIAGGIVLALASGSSQESDGSPETWASALTLALGVLFLLLAARSWQGRPRAGEEAPMPEWMQAIDTFTAGKSLGAGVVLSALNPKTLVLTVAAATAIAQAGLDGGEAAGALAIYVLVGSSTILGVLAAYFALGTRAAATLDDVKTWMAAYNAVIMAVLLLVIGAKLIGDGIAGLSA